MKLFAVLKSIYNRLGILWHKRAQEALKFIKFLRKGVLNEKGFVYVTRSHFYDGDDPRACGRG